jgi:hypothetical protein
LRVWTLVNATGDALRRARISESTNVVQTFSARRRAISVRRRYLIAGVRNCVTWVRVEVTGPPLAQPTEGTHGEDGMRDMRWVGLAWVLLAGPAGAGPQKKDGFAVTKEAGAVVVKASASPARTRSMRSSSRASAAIVAAGAG